MFLFDTDILTLFLYGHQRVVARAGEVLDSEVGIPIIAKIEILRRRFEKILKSETQEKILLAQAQLFQTELELGRIRLVALSESSLQRYFRLRETKGVRSIGKADLLIAAIAVENNAILVTRNVRDFKKVPQLQMVDWTK